MTESYYAHGLKLIARLDILKLEKLYQAFGSFKAIWNAKTKEIQTKTGENNLTEILEQRKDIDLEKEFIDLKKQGIKIITIADLQYPSLLRETPHPPLAFYYLGELYLDELKDKKFIHKAAIVGTRKATGYGLKIARDLGRDLSVAGILVVSGLALGIDAEAHRGALEGGAPTWAVLGSGLASIYPSSHRFLAQKIIEKGGAIISEYPPKAKPTKWTFPERNRIIAGLTQATIVVEAPLRSGALITANFALEYNREVGAVPGEISSLNSEGTNSLIKKGAALIRNSEDVFELLGLEKRELPSLFDNLEEIDILIINSLAQPKTTDELAEIAKLSAPELNQRITMLELQGFIKNANGLIQKTS